jgi:hypothetical protein
LGPGFTAFNTLHPELLLGSGAPCGGALRRVYLRRSGLAGSAVLPGAIGFLYFSGSRWFVFFGMFWLTVLAMVVESVVKAALRNPYATSLIALYVVSMIIHLNPGLSQKLLSLLTTLIACLMFAAASRHGGGSFGSGTSYQS